MHDIEVTVAIHVGNAESFAPLSGCRQAFIESFKSQFRNGRAVPLDRAGRHRPALAKFRLTRAASDEDGYGQTCGCKAYEFQEYAVWNY